MKKITEVAKVIRSKNCSPFDLTLDIIFRSTEYYNAVKNINVITSGKVAELYGIPEEKVGKVIWFEPANAVKITMKRRISSGSPGDSDVYGAQQHAPLLSLTFDI